MTWNLSGSGISETNIPLYDSPFPPSSNRLAASASKLTFGVADKNYSASTFKKYVQPQNANISNRRAANRMDYNASEAMNFNVNDSKSDSFKYSTNAEAYEYLTKINSSTEWREKAAEQEELIDKVMRKIIETASITVQHKIFGTSLPSKYICKMVFLTLLEQEFANKYSGDSVNKSAFLTSKDVCDAMYKVYMNENINKNKIALSKKNKTNELLMKLDDNDQATAVFEFDHASTISRRPFRIEEKCRYTPEKALNNKTNIISNINNFIKLLNHSSGFIDNETIDNIYGNMKIDSLQTQEDAIDALKRCDVVYSIIAETEISDDVLNSMRDYILQTMKTIERENSIAVADVRGDEMIVVADNNIEKNANDTVTVSSMMKIVEFDKAFSDYVTKAIYTRESFGESDSDSVYAKLKKQLDSVEISIQDAVERLKNEKDEATKQMLEIKKKDLSKIKNGIKDEINKLENVTEDQPSPINDTDVSIIDANDKESVMEKLDRDISILEKEMTDAWLRFKHRRLLERKKEQKLKIVGVKLPSPAVSIKETVNKIKNNINNDDIHENESFRNYIKEPPSSSHLLMIVVVILIVICLAVFAIYNLCLCRERSRYTDVGAFGV